MGNFTGGGYNARVGGDGSEARFEIVESLD